MTITERLITLALAAIILTIFYGDFVRLPTPKKKVLYSYVPTKSIGIIALPEEER